MAKSLEIDFGGTSIPSADFMLYEEVIKDRGSVYSVAIGKVTNRAEIKAFIQKVRNYNKKYQKATHHSYAARVSRDGVVYETKADDGETGAGAVILRGIQKKRFMNTAICITRWFGGIKLQGDRFRHVQDATLLALERSSVHNTQ
jgi:putative IMPACT (imprinted ancient) family translation regulator